MDFPDTRFKDIQLDEAWWVKDKVDNKNVVLGRLVKINQNNMELGCIYK